MPKQTYTVDEIRAATRATHFTLRTCKACGTPTSYRTNAEALLFISACGCVVKGVPERPASWEQLAEFISAQRESVQGRIMRELGTPPKADPAAGPEPAQEAQANG